MSSCYICLLVKTWNNDPGITLDEEHGDVNAKQCKYISHLPVTIQRGSLYFYWRLCILSLERWGLFFDLMDDVWPVHNVSAFFRQVLAAWVTDACRSQSYICIQYIQYSIKLYVHLCFVCIWLKHKQINVNSVRFCKLEKNFH